jgi:hypothetical protein
MGEYMLSLLTFIFKINILFAAESGFLRQYGAKYRVFFPCCYWSFFIGARCRGILKHPLSADFALSCLCFYFFCRKHYREIYSRENILSGDYYYSRFLYYLAHGGSGEILLRHFAEFALKLSERENKPAAGIFKALFAEACRLARIFYSENADLRRGGL